MVITNCWECGKVLSNDLREIEGIKQDKIFCKKCRKLYQRGQIPKAEPFTVRIKRELLQDNKAEVQLSSH